MYAASVDSLAASIGIPSWVVHCRHASCHGSRFPPLTVLKRASASLLREFIIPKYWIVQRISLPGKLLGGIPHRVLQLREVQQIFSKSAMESTALDFPTDSSISFSEDAIHWLVTRSCDYITGKDAVVCDNVYDGIFTDVVERESQFSIVETAVMYQKKLVLLSALNSRTANPIAVSAIIQSSFLGGYDQSFHGDLLGSLGTDVSIHNSFPTKEYSDQYAGECFFIDNVGAPSRI